MVTPQVGTEVGGNPHQVSAEDVAFFLLRLAPRQAAAVLAAAAVGRGRYGQVSQALDAVVLAEASDPVRGPAAVWAVECRLVNSGALAPRWLRPWRSDRLFLPLPQLLRVGDALLAGLKLRAPGPRPAPEGPLAALQVSERPAWHPAPSPTPRPTPDRELFLACLPRRLTGLAAERRLAQGASAVLVLTSGLVELAQRGGLSLERALALLDPSRALTAEEEATVARWGREPAPLAFSGN